MALWPDHPPRLLRWRRRVYRLTHAEGPERLLPEWWQPDLARRPPWCQTGRDYFHAEADTGERFWLFREHGTPGRWYVHGFF